MTVKVFKFGGSSLADTDSFAAVMRICEQDVDTKVIVVSAIGGTTDILEFLASQAAQDQRQDEAEQLDRLKDKHRSIIEAFVPSEQIETMLSEFESDFTHLKAILNSLAVLKELTPRILAQVVSLGEQFAAKILTASLQSKKDNVVYLNSTKVLKLKNDNGQQSPDDDRSKRQIDLLLRPLLSEKKTVIMPGFIASDPDGDVTTLGRGGSDYSATLIASYLRASSVYLYKEVDGLLTADPKLVNNTRVVPELHYREATELAFYGANILHPRSIIPLLEHSIPLYIKNTFKPELSGTKIAQDVSPGAYPVKALTAIQHQVMISVEGKGMLGVPGIAARTFTALASKNISVSLITQASSESSICFTVPQKQAIEARELLASAFKYEISNHLIDDIKALSDQTVIAIVGLGMSGTHGIAARAFEAVRESKVNVNAIAQGSSELNISLVIDSIQISEALQSLHDEYRLDRIKALPQKNSSEVNLLFHGFGQIGQTLAGQIQSQHEYFDRKLQIKVPIVGVSDSKGYVFAESGFSQNQISGFIDRKQKKESLQGSPNHKTQSLAAVLENSTFHKGILVDITSEDTSQEIFDALNHSYHVVLANKKPLSIPYETYLEMFALAEKKKLMIRYEATVGAGLPVLDTLEKLLGAGDKILEIKGCLSGTLGYIMSSLEQGSSFSGAVKTAFEKGFTEPDPRDDLSGIDVARKALILARHLGIQVNMEDIALDPLFYAEQDDDDPVKFLKNLETLDEAIFDRTKKAKDANCVLRYVAKLSESGVTVGIEDVPKESSLGQLSGTANQVCIQSHRYSDNPLIVTGPGAGADVTAAGVLNDIIAIAASHDRGF